MKKIIMCLVALVLMVAKVDAATLTQVVGDNYINVEVDSGQTISLSFNNVAGYTFTKWVVETGNVTLASTTNPNVSFAMPNSDVTIRANYAEENAVTPPPTPTTTTTVNIDGVIYTSTSETPTISWDSNGIAGNDATWGNYNIVYLDGELIYRSDAGPAAGLSTANDSNIDPSQGDIKAGTTKVLTPGETYNYYYLYAAWTTYVPEIPAGSTVVHIGNNILISTSATPVLGVDAEGNYAYLDSTSNKVSLNGYGYITPVFSEPSVSMGSTVTLTAGNTYYYNWCDGACTGGSSAIIYKGNVEFVSIGGGSTGVTWPNATTIQFWGGEEIVSTSNFVGLSLANDKNVTSTGDIPYGTEDMWSGDRTYYLYDSEDVISCWCCGEIGCTVCGIQGEVDDVQCSNCDKCICYSHLNEDEGMYYCKDCKPCYICHTTVGVCRECGNCTNCSCSCSAATMTTISLYGSSGNKIGTYTSSSSTPTISWGSDGAAGSHDTWGSHNQLYLDGDLIYQNDAEPAAGLSVANDGNIDASQGDIEAGATQRLTAGQTYNYYYLLASSTTLVDNYTYTDTDTDGDGICNACGNPGTTGVCPICDKFVCENCHPYYPYCSASCENLSNELECTTCGNSKTRCNCGTLFCIDCQSVWYPYCSNTCYYAAQGICTGCGLSLSQCTYCGTNVCVNCDYEYSPYCSADCYYKATCGHGWQDGVCIICGRECNHSWEQTIQGLYHECSTCGMEGMCTSDGGGSCSVCYGPYND